jgi:hypothetical protein
LADVDVGGFAYTLLEDVHAHAQAAECSLDEAFTGLMLDQFCADGHSEDAMPAYFREHGVEVSGWGASADDRVLDLFLTLYSPRADEDYKIDRNGILVAFKRIENFLSSCISGAEASGSPSSEVEGMRVAVREKFRAAEKVRLLLVTNARGVMRERLPAAHIHGRPVVRELWDLTRLANWASSGSKAEPITADFPDGLCCLAAPSVGDHAVYLAIVPARELASLYSVYGSRLLELNVRSFLQIRGAVNKGILETLRTDPKRFLAYNNGISAIASLVEFDEATAPERSIRRIHNLQIVNGGQTTATIHYAHRARINLDGVHVQMKLTVVPPDKLDAIVPQIAAFSNTQNRVTASDLKANGAFHVEIERIIRSLWAPPSPTAAYDTHWFYERARGQYANAVAREATEARRKIFRQTNPPGQRFTKSELAKYVNSWDALPHLVSLGAEKNFVLFSESLDAVPITVDKDFCCHLIAKAILFRQVDKIVAKQAFGGYKANIVTYTIAKLVAATGGRVNLDKIWREQALSRALAVAAAEISVVAQKVITNPPAGRKNIGEWAKRQECWDELKATEWAIPADLEPELLEVDTYGADLDLVRSFPAPDWSALVAWGAATGQLDATEQETASEIARVMLRGWDPAGKHVQAGAELMRRSASTGFRAALRGGERGA